MAQNFKVLGQSNPTAQTYTTLYTVPASTQAVISTISICNFDDTTSSNANFSIAVRPAGANLTNQHLLVSNNVIQYLDTIALTLGITLGNTDVVSVYSSTSNLSFGLYGSEIT
jgi:hypothetical protein